jgi:RNase H-fold protein (predicted Holliday junction resolvase)
MRRIIAIDVGYKVTGVACADLTHDGSPEIHLLTTVLSDFGDKPAEYMRKIQECLENVVRPKDLILLERMVSKNFKVTARNRAIRTYYESKNVFVQDLLPTQKVGVNKKKNADRKKQSVSIAEEVLLGTGWFETFQRLPRNHDVADALLMIEYIRHNPDKIKKAAQT